MKRFTILFAALLLLAPVLAAAPPAGVPAGLDAWCNCTGLIAGRGTTVDGSILFAKSEDDTPASIDFLWRIPRRQYAPGSVLRLENGGAIPQVAETYAYMWDQGPGTSFSNNVVNEWGVAIGSNACLSREDPVEEVAARGDLVDGGLAFELRMILAERARTAREAVQIAADLLDRHGYNASGRCLHIVGPAEAWQLQMVRGKQYVARRVQDDEVAIIANTYSIREVDPADRENFVCSPRLVEYAVERGWYDPDAGKPFDFAATYAHRNLFTHFANTDRQWDLGRLVDAGFPVSWREARTGVLPVSATPDRKLSVADLMAIFRDHYEGTPLDSTDSYRLSPHHAPGRPICCNTTHRTTIIQERSWLPPAIGTVVWRALEPPCTSGFVPWYLGITRIPAAFQAAPLRADTARAQRVDFHFHMPPETFALDTASSGGLFKFYRRLVDGDYARTIGMVRKTWDGFEAEALGMQAAVEKTALELWETDPPLAREFLTLYSGAMATRSMEIARQLVDELPLTAGVLTARGVWLFEAGDPAAAAADFEAALAARPGDAEAARLLDWARAQMRLEAERPPELPVRLLDRLAGEYGERHIFRRGDQLFYRRGDGPEYRLVPIDERTFALEGNPAFRLRFADGKGGVVEAVEGLSFDGRTDRSARTR
ncbi:MAG: C69 family dipeptidase [Candidatus Krumholzibacteriota bacterium]|nr:C69 family dipeptidase [Candidatus Krumholzibacteriota bacterium]